MLPDMISIVLKGSYTNSEEWSLQRALKLKASGIFFTSLGKN